MKELSDLMNKDKNTDLSQEQILLKNLDKITKMSPMTGSMIRSYFFQKVLDEARNPDGSYNPSNLLDGLEKNRRGLSPADQGQIAESAKLIADSQGKAKTIAEQAKILGSTPDEVIANIGKIKSLDELNRFAELTGKTPAELGQVFMKSSLLKNESEVAQVEGETNTIGILEETIKDIRKFEGKGIESQDVIEQMFPKDIQETIKNIEETIKKYKDISGKKATSLPVRTFKISAGILLTMMHHIVMGPSWVIKGLSEGVKEGDVTTPEPVKTVTDLEGKTKITRSKTTPKPKTKSKIKAILSPDSNLMKYGGTAANAQENQE
jgi:hypothetical protein